MLISALYKRLPESSLLQWLAQRLIRFRPSIIRAAGVPFLLGAYSQDLRQFPLTAFDNLPQAPEVKHGLRGRRQVSKTGEPWQAHIYLLPYPDEASRILPEQNTRRKSRGNL